MSEITRGQIVRVGVDLAKQVIQVHAVDGAGRRVVARAIKRDQFVAWCAQLPPGCMVAMEACSGAHHWGRELRRLGLDARLIAANFVSPYRMEGRSGKNDMTDAAAICEAASRPTMRFVPVKTCEQQAVMSLHQGRTNRVHQPHPRRAGRARAGVRQEPQGAARGAGRCIGGRQQHADRAGSAGAAARVRPMARA